MRNSDFQASIAAIAVAAMAVGSGCASAPIAHEALPTLTAQASFVQMTGLAEGTLMAERGCIRLTRIGGLSRLVIWPHGTQFSGRHIALPSGKSVPLGQTVTLGGGDRDDVPTTMLVSPLSAACGGPYFIAAERVR